MLELRILSPGPGVALRAFVPLLKIQRTLDRGVMFTVSGQLSAENVNELRLLVDSEPVGAVVVLDLTDLVLADRDAVCYLRACESGERIALRNCPTYIREWMATEESD